MAYTNSSLVSYKKLSPNHSGKRTHSIDRISPHCVVGQLSVETLGNIFANTSRKASCNYAIGKDGRVALIVEEKNRSWCTSSNSNDQRAVTIEIASDTKHPYTMNSKAYNKFIDLCVDICKRNGKKKLLWLGKSGITYSPKSGEMVLTVHRWFANKACPGDWLYNRLDDVAKEVTKRLGGKETASSTTSSASKKTNSEVKAWQKAAIKDGFKFESGADGVWGKECESVAKEAIIKARKSNGKSVYKYQNLTKIVQKKLGVTADGLCGSSTESAIKKWQKKKNLTVDGCIGLKSWKKILGV